MVRTSIEHYVIDATKINIPDKGLGNFMYGFTEERTPFNWAWIWFNLIPIVGQLIFVLFVISYWMVRSHPQRIFLYQNGFIKQKLGNKGRVKKESVINFLEINGMRYTKTQQYQNTYGIRIYQGTGVTLSVLNSNNIEDKILTGSYRNKHEVDGKYNFIGYACNAIDNTWIPFAINKFNHELSTQGYGTFSTPSGEVLVGKDFIRTKSVVVSSGFKYSFDNGYLYLYPNAAEGAFKQKSKPIAINVAAMYNKEVFLMAISQLHGIR